MPLFDVHLKRGNRWPVLGQVTADSHRDAAVQTFARRKSNHILGVRRFHGSDSMTVFRRSYNESQGEVILADRSESTSTPEEPSPSPRAIKVTVTDADGVVLDSKAFLLLGGASKLGLVPMKQGEVDTKAIEELQIGN